MRKTRSLVEERIREERDAGKSYRAIAKGWGIGKHYTNIYRIHIGGRISNRLVNVIASASGVARPPYHTYRPCLRTEYRRYDNHEIMRIIDEWEINTEN